MWYSEAYEARVKQLLDHYLPWQNVAHIIVTKAAQGVLQSTDTISLEK